MSGSTAMFLSAQKATAPASRAKYPSGDNQTSAGYYIECRVHARYTSTAGDSGAPVFVEVDDGSTSEIEVVLVGVHWGRSDIAGLGYRQQVIPIDRVYAEFLLAGADWDDAALRPLPTLIDRNPVSPNPPKG